MEMEEGRQLKAMNNVRMTQDPNRKTSDRETQKAALKVRPRKKKWDRHEGWKREGHVMQKLKRFRVAFPPESLDTLTDQDTWADISGLWIRYHSPKCPVQLESFCTSGTGHR